MKMNNGSKLKKILLKMENDKKDPLPKNIYYEYQNNNKKMREYHVDSHLRFQDMSPSMSIRCEPKAKQLFILAVRTRAASGSTPSLEEMLVRTRWRDKAPPKD